MVEHFPYIHKTLGSTPSTTKINTKPIGLGIVWKQQEDGARRKATRNGKPIRTTAGTSICTEPLMWKGVQIWKNFSLKEANKATIATQSKSVLSHQVQNRLMD